jgi:carboxymethylenebutenolidase
VIERHDAVARRRAAFATCAIVGLLVVHPDTLAGQQPHRLSAAGARPIVSGVLLEPKVAGRHPAVILLPGAGGWRPDHLEFARALTAAGFVTLTLDYYVETGEAAIGSQERLAKWPAWQTTLRAAAALVQQLPSVDGMPIGLLGFSRGAFLAVSVAGSLPAVRAVVDLYGGGGGGPASLTDDVRGMPPLLILHGAADSVVPVRFARELYDAAQSAGAVVEIHLYPRIGHAFTIGTFPTYSEAATEDAVRRAIAFFHRWLEN